MPPLPTCTAPAEGNCFLDVPAMDDFTCSPTTSDGEITELLLTHTPFLAGDFSDAVAFAARIDNTGVAADAVIRLKVTGKLLAPEVSETEVEGGVTVPSSRKKFGIEATFYNDSDNNYSAAKTMMHCGKPVLLYFVMGGKIYGGITDIETGISTNLSILPSSEGKDSLLKYDVKATWRATTLPNRAAYALA